MNTQHLTWNVRHITMAAVIAAVSGMMLAGPAAAEVIEGDCSGALTTADDVALVDTDQPITEPVAIPAQGTLEFTGSFGPDVERDTPAEVQGELRGQHPFGSWQIARWQDETLTGQAQGTESYSLPRFLPRGSGPVALELEVTVDDERCLIVGSAQIDGARWDGLTLTALVIAVLLLVATLFAGRRDARGQGRPLVGMLAGVLTGIAAAATLFGSGIIALDSPVWWGLPAVGVALGLLLGATAPFGKQAPDETAQPDPTTPASTDGDGDPGAPTA